MFDGLRERLRRLARPPTRHVPPTAPTPGAAAAVRDALEALREGAPARFARLFVAGRPAHVSRVEAERLEVLRDHGLVEHVGASVWRPRVRVLPFEGRLVAADLATHEDADQVFSPMFEQVYAVRHMDVRGADRVLELGVGSGVLSLFAAAAAARVTAVDVSERALAFARFNLAVNPVAAPCDLRLGSLYEPLDEGERFDLILSNPPFEPHPPGVDGYRHSAGGEDGLDVVRLLLARAPRHLAPQGRLEMISWSPGTRDEALLVELTREALPGRSLDVHHLATWPIEEHLDRFRREAAFPAWCDRLATRGLTHLHFLFVHAEPASRPAVATSHPDAAIAVCRAIAAAWVS